MVHHIESEIGPLGNPQRESGIPLGGIIAQLDSALVADPPLLARDGGFIAARYDAELDTARDLRDHGRSVIAAMQAEYSRKSGITALKVKHNNVLGYFVETPAKHAEKMLSPPLSDRFIHRQTTANAMRFTTIDLREMETEILNAGGRALAIELAHYQSLIPTVIDQNPCAHLRMPRDMIFHGWSMRLFQAWQHSATMSS